MSKISLRKIKISDKKYFAKWWRDGDLIKFTSGRPKLISDRKVDKYFSMMIDGKNDHHFMIILGKRVIGHIALMKKKNNWYETIIIIGEKEYWNKGYGVQAIESLTNKARRLGISKIYLEVRPNNLRAIRAYEKCGFVRKGLKKYPKNKYLPETLRMELIGQPIKSNDKEIINFLKIFQKELTNFFGIKTQLPKVFLLDSRKQIDQIRREKTEPWIVGWAKNNTIYVLSPNVFTTESNHRDANEFWGVLKHEYGHIAVEKFCECKRAKPSWLIEGLCCYLAEQKKRQPTETEILAVFRDHLNNKEVYIAGYFWVKFLIEKFGKQKILKLLKMINQQTNKRKFSKKFYQVYKIQFSKKNLKNAVQNRIKFKFGQKTNKKVEELVNLLPKGGRVLDLGCGAGGNSIFLAKKGFNLTAVDSDKEVIDEIKKNYPNINAINSEILDFDFSENEYDLILTLNVLHFLNLEDIKKIVSGMLKSLKENGLIYIQAFSVNNPSKKFAHLFTKEELKEIFSENKILELEEILVKDNHPPQGKHEHSIIRLLVRK